jgi:hypothetical protein
MDDLLAAAIGLGIGIVLFLGGLWVIAAVFGADDGDATEETLARIESESAHRGELLEVVRELTRQNVELATKRVEAAQFPAGLLILGAIIIALIVSIALVTVAVIISRGRQRPGYPPHYFGPGPYYDQTMIGSPYYLGTDPNQMHQHYSIIERR